MCKEEYERSLEDGKCESSILKEIKNEVCISQESERGGGGGGGGGGEGGGGGGGGFLVLMLIRFSDGHACLHRSFLPRLKPWLHFM